MSVKARQTSGSKLDLHRLHRDEYAPAREPIIVDVGEGRYLAVDGRGEPGGPEFQDKLGALYGMAFTIKMTRKHAGLGDYVIAGLEGQYWPDPGVSALDAPLDIMNWRLMVRTPEAVTEDDLDAARSTLKQRDRGAWVDNVITRRSRQRSAQWWSSLERRDSRSTDTITRSISRIHGAFHPSACERSSGCR